MWAVCDIESTGLDIKQDRVIEFAYVLYEPQSKKIIEMQSSLFFEPGMVESKEDALEAHGITLAMRREYGESFPILISMVNITIEKVDCLVFHGGTQFDVPMLQMEFIRQQTAMPETKLIDTYTDLPWAKNARSRALNYAAADSGFVNPFPHRALPDCLTLIRLIEKYDPAEIIFRAESPTVVIQANVSFEDREKAKGAGFRWQPVQKQWLKTLKQFELEKEKYDFPVQKVLI